ncbi:MAG: hypothetical protein GY814_08095 [Gammaproteobacteria bacterium]|nr:hypothetical protein [Gammaproteobacteria bacterium]
MEFLYFTIAGVILYGLSDFILNKIENARGARFPNRSVIFLIIIMILALGSFTIIEHLTKDLTTTPVATSEKTTTQSPSKGG